MILEKSMKYQVTYMIMEPNKKNGSYIKQTATFLDVSGAIFWENHIKENGAKNVETIPVFS